MRGRAAVLASLIAGMLGTLGVAGCAHKQWKFDTLEKRDQLRFAACRTDVRRQLCPDDPDCEAKAAQSYAEERPDARLQWLLDYGCAREKIQHVDDLERKREHERIGMPAE